VVEPSVRQLKHCIERAWALSDGPDVGIEDLSTGLRPICGRATSDAGPELKGFLQGCERARILEVLEGNGWSIIEAASDLGISRKNLWEKMRRLRIERHQ
jgi:transcriptional regulator of acetoin/glycerol metabolism